MLIVEEYILQTKELRQQHLQLDEPCLERGGMSSYFKGLLAHILGTTIHDGKRILVCHACHNAKCSNPNHLYWGTPTENVNDTYSNGRKSIWESMVDKYGEETARDMQKRKGASLAGKIGGSKKKSEEHKKRIAESVKLAHAIRKEKQSLPV